MSEILRLLRLSEVGKTEIMYGLRLTHYQTQTYLKWLIEIRLVDRRQGNGRWVSYRITPKGLDLLSKIEQVQEMLHVEEISAILDSPELKVDQRQNHHILRRIGDAIRPRRRGADD